MLTLLTFCPPGPGEREKRAESHGRTSSMLIRVVLTVSYNSPGAVPGRCILENCHRRGADPVIHSPDYWVCERIPLHLGKFVRPGSRSPLASRLGATVRPTQPKERR